MVQYNHYKSCVETALLMEKFRCVYLVKTLSVFLCLAAFFILSSQVQANEITPSDVYQRTEELRVKLDALGLLNMQEYEAEKYDDALRHPRHVFQKVRECHSLISKILISKGNNPSALPKIVSKREVSPRDVMRGVNHLVSETEKIDDVTVPQVKVIKPTAKVSNDVFNNLKNICRSLQVNVTPDEVYQVAKAVNEHMKMMLRHRDYQFDEKIQLPANKTHFDVYYETLSLFDNLYELSLNPDYAILGGVILQKNRNGKIKQNDIISLMYEAYAEVEAIEYALHIEEEAMFPVHESGKTNSDVFAQVYGARMLVEKIIDLEKQINNEVFGNAP